jgi:hypothetical protein
MMRLMLKFGSLVLFVLLYSPLLVQAAAEFSADTVETHPQYGEHKGHLYMGKDRMRTDYEINGEHYSQIVDFSRQMAIMINHDQKTYVLSQAGSADLARDKSAVNNGNPCTGMQNLDCKDAGSDTVNGRPAHKWEISRAGQPGKMVFWLDESRKIPVRQQMPDGSLMEMRMVGNESVNGRNTEKWESTSQLADGSKQTALQWYDPQLNTIIREQQVGGIIRDLVNIKPGDQSDELFSVPAGYQQQAMPQEPDR